MPILVFQITLHAKVNSVRRTPTPQNRAYGSIHGSSRKSDQSFEILSIL